jgi:hypothetical protein
MKTLLDHLEIEFWRTMERGAPDARYLRSYRWKTIQAMLKANAIRIPDPHDFRCELNQYVDSSNWRVAFVGSDRIDGCK